MASFPNPTSSNPYEATERLGISSERTAPSNVKTGSPMSSMKSDGEESFPASDLFCQRMRTMINKQDVESMLEKQAETLTKFEKINATFGRFNDLSTTRFLHLNQQLKNHTKMLVDMKKDLDSVFRRIRTLKTKLTKQYGPAFHATSANIQKLEEELEASIENEDASVSTLTESKEQNSDRQMEGQSVEFKNTEEEQLEPGELPSQDSYQSFEEKTTMNKSSDYAAENRTTAQASDFQRLGNDDFSRSISSAQDKEFIRRTVATEAIIKTVDANNMSQSVGDSGTLETSVFNRSGGTDNVLQTVDTNCKTQTIGTGDTTEIVNTVDKTEALENGSITETADTDNKTQTLDTGNTSEIVNRSHKSQALDTWDTTQTADTRDFGHTSDAGHLTEMADKRPAPVTAQTLDTDGTTELADTNDTAQTDTDDTTEIADEGDVMQMLGTGDTTQAVDSGDKSQYSEDT